MFHMSSWIIFFYWPSAKYMWYYLIIYPEGIIEGSINMPSTFWSILSVGSVPAMPYHHYHPRGPGKVTMEKAHSFIDKTHTHTPALCQVTVHMLSFNFDPFLSLTHHINALQLSYGHGLSTLLTVTMRWGHIFHTSGNHSLTRVTYISFTPPSDLIVTFMCRCSGKVTSFFLSITLLCCSLRKGWCLSSVRKHSKVPFRHTIVSFYSILNSKVYTDELIRGRLSLIMWILRAKLNGKIDDNCDM